MNLKRTIALTVLLIALGGIQPATASGIAQNPYAGQIATIPNTYTLALAP